MRIHKQDGITLIEVLVAMLILSIGVLALISLDSNVHSSISTRRNDARRSLAISWLLGLAVATLPTRCPL